jgi:hypothetical protein
MAVRDASDWDPGPCLRRHLDALVGERSPSGEGAGLRRAEEYVARVFEGAGLIVLREPIGAAHDRWHNVLGDLPGDPPATRAAGGDGAGRPAVGTGGGLGGEAGRGDSLTDSTGRGSPPPLFIVGGHIDAVEGSPGADDNASGAAVMLALAERMAAIPSSARRVTLRFAGFNLEEWGMVGSQSHADGLAAAGRAVEGMISLEMLGYVGSPGERQKYPPGIGLGRRKKPDFISVVGDRRSRPLVREVAEALRSVDGLPVESISLPGPLALLVGAALSDHASFWRHGIPAVMVGDTAFYRNPHYHAPSDGLESLSMPFLERVTRGLGRFLEALVAPRS